MSDLRHVDLVRHGQVDNPRGVLYGRLSGFGLSELGHAMAERLAEHYDGVRIDALVCSPLKRTRQTIAPIAAARPEVELVVDERVIEAANIFEGRVIGRNYKGVLDPSMLWHLRDPFRPSWGEPYLQIAARMRAAINDALARVPDSGRAVICAHQLPIWIARMAAEGRRLAHDPRSRQCVLASVTTLSFRGGRVVSVSYAEPAADLLPPKRGRRFVVGA